MNSDERKVFATWFDQIQESNGFYFDRPRNFDTMTLDEIFADMKSQLEEAKNDIAKHAKELEQDRDRDFNIGMRREK